MGMPWHQRTRAACKDCGGDRAAPRWFVPQNRRIPPPLVSARKERSSLSPPETGQCGLSAANTSICQFNALRFFLISTLLIHPLLRYRAPHTAPGILYVAGVPGDDVDVEVHHRLAGGGANVRADVVAVGVELPVKEGFCFPGEGEEGGEFRVGRVEEAGDVPEGDEEEVAGIFIHSAPRIPLSVSKECMRCFFIPCYNLKNIYLGAEGNIYGEVNAGQ